MDDTKEKILKLFQEKGCEISTSEIASHIYPSFNELKSINNEKSKREIAKLHRRLLHHINILIKEDLLRISRHGEKGQKFFVLNLEEGEEIISINPKYKKRVSISKPLLPSFPIESYEEAGIIVKYEKEKWIDMINSFCVDCSYFSSLNEIKKVIISSMEVINDSFCLVNFEKYLEDGSNEELFNFIREINDVSFSFNRLINFFIDFERLKENEVTLSFFDFCLNKNIERILFVFSLNHQVLNQNYSLIKKIFSFYIREKKVINLMNNYLTKDIVFIGKAGPYLINKADFESKENLPFFACSQRSLFVDFEKFYYLYGFNSKKFSDLMLCVSKSFLSANFIQRKRLEIYFKKLVDYLGNRKKDFLEYSKNYVRLCNFSLLSEKLGFENMLNIIVESRKKIENFSVAEETIYKSCGMPIRFKLALSCAFKKSNESLREANYNKIFIYNLEDLYSSKLKKEVKNREKLSEVFSEGNDVVFNRVGSQEIEDIIREISFILSTFRLCFFSYNSEGIKKDMKITEFF